MKPHLSRRHPAPPRTTINFCARLDDENDETHEPDSFAFTLPSTSANKPPSSATLDLFGDCNDLHEMDDGIGGNLDHMILRTATNRTSGRDTLALTCGESNRNSHSGDVSIEPIVSQHDNQSFHGGPRAWDGSYPLPDSSTGSRKRKQTHPEDDSGGHASRKSLSSKKGEGGSRKDWDDESIEKRVHGGTRPPGPMIPMNAPTQPRHYTTPSATSRKLTPSSSSKLVSSDDADVEDLPKYARETGMDMLDDEGPGWGTKHRRLSEDRSLSEPDFEALASGSRAVGNIPVLFGGNILPNQMQGSPSPGNNPGPSNNNNSPTSRQSTSPSNGRQQSPDPINSGSGNEGSDSLPPSLLSQIETKRRQNTLAARRSRQRKAEYVKTLETQVDELARERDDWMERAKKAEEELKKFGVKPIV